MLFLGIERKTSGRRRINRQSSAELDSAVSQVCSLRLLETIRRLALPRHAGYKPAIQQIENLRYDLGLDAAQASGLRGADLLDSPERPAKISGMREQIVRCPRRMASRRGWRPVGGRPWVQLGP